jgi:hypothetical protein
MSTYTFEDYDLYTIGYDFANRKDQTMVVRAPNTRIARELAKWRFGEDFPYKIHFIEKNS